MTRVDGGGCDGGQVSMANPVGVCLRDFSEKCARVCEACLAQLVDRKILNLVVVGSSPTVGDYQLCDRNGCSPDLFRAALFPSLRYSGLSAGLALEQGAPFSTTRIGQAEGRTLPRVRNSVHTISSRIETNGQYHGDGVTQLGWTAM
uniref:Uncharacterized protein n=1 Tax=Peronospora matthiolae TaxID=2874970 RepID=A0AAV1V6X2_9STRA